MNNSSNDNNDNNKSNNNNSSNNNNDTNININNNTNRSWMQINMPKKMMMCGRNVDVRLCEYRKHSTRMELTSKPQPWLVGLKWPPVHLLPSNVCG